MRHPTSLVRPLAPLISLVLVAAACSAGDESATTSPNDAGTSTSTTTIATTTTVPVTTTAAAPRLCQPGERSCPFPLAPGTHPTLNLLIPVTFEVPEGWSKPLDVPGSVNLHSSAFEDAHIGILPDWAIASQEQCVRDPEPGMGRTVADLVSFLTGHPGLITSPPSAVSVGGLDGQVLEVKKDPAWSGACPGRVNLFTHVGTIDDPGWWDIDDEMQFRLYILDAGEGHTVTVHVETWGDTSFEAFVAAAQPVVESFAFGAAKTSG